MTSKQKLPPAASVTSVQPEPSSLAPPESANARSTMVCRPGGSDSEMAAPAAKLRVDSGDGAVGDVTAVGRVAGAVVVELVEHGAGDDRSVDAAVLHTVCARESRSSASATTEEHKTST